MDSLSWPGVAKGDPGRIGPPKAVSALRFATAVQNAGALQSILRTSARLWSAVAKRSADTAFEREPMPSILTNWLFITQCLHRVNACGPPRGKGAGEQG